MPFILTPDGEVALLMLVMPVLQLCVVMGVARAAALMIVDFLALLIEAGRDDVDHAEVSAFDDLQERLTRVLRQHEVGRAVLQEVDLLDLFAFVVDILVR